MARRRLTQQGPLLLLADESDESKRDSQNFSFFFFSLGHVLQGLHLALHATPISRLLSLRPDVVLMQCQELCRRM